MPTAQPISAGGSVAWGPGAAGRWARDVWPCRSVTVSGGLSGPAGGAGWAPGKRHPDRLRLAPRRQVRNLFPPRWTAGQPRRAGLTSPHPAPASAPPASRPPPARQCGEPGGNAGLFSGVGGAYVQPRRPGRFDTTPYRVGCRPSFVLHRPQTLFTSTVDERRRGQAGAATVDCRPRVVPPPARAACPPDSSGPAPKSDVLAVSRREGG